jgi:hypothetical protein
LIGPLIEVAVKRMPAFSKAVLIAAMLFAIGVRLPLS